MNLEIVTEVFAGLGFVFRFRFFPFFPTCYAGFGEQFVKRADSFHLPGFFANPNRQRGSPEAFAGQRPVNVGCQEVAKASVFDVIRHPVDFAVVFQHLVYKRRRFDIPAFTWILNQRVFFFAITERVFVKVLFQMEQDSALFEVAGNVFVGFFDPASRPVRGNFRKLPVRTNGADEFRSRCVSVFVYLVTLLLIKQNAVVVFAKGGRLMYQTRPGIGCNKFRRDDSPGDVFFRTVEQFALLVTQCFVIVVKRRDVSQTDQV